MVEFLIVTFWGVITHPRLKCKDGFTFGDIHQLFNLQDQWGQGPRLVHGGDVVLQLALKHIQLISHIHKHAEFNDNELWT